MINRRKSLTLFGGIAASISSSRACLWDRDTLKDELATNPEVLDLILGQFPHHSDLYYETRRSRLEKKANLDVLEVNDLAVALVRLKKYDKGMAILEAQLKKNPNHYETLSNIGVTAKKSGDFEKGANFIARALKIKPEGHMGLGDWYLKALEWRIKFENASEKNPPKLNYLGHPYLGNFDEKKYGGEMQSHSDRQNKTLESHLKMVRNDQSFADGFAALGDRLNHQADLNLAFLAYTRAMVLGHQNPVEIRRRRRTYLKHAEYFIGDRSSRKVRGLAYWRSEIAKAEKMISDGLAWLKSYKTTEAELIKKQGDERKVDIEHVETKLKQRKILRVSIS